MLSILYRGAIASIAIRVLGVGITLLLHMLLTRNMGLEEYGIYVTVLNTFLIAAIIAKVGLPELSVRYISQYLAQKKCSQLQGFFKFSGLILVISSGTVGCLLFLLVQVFSLNVDLSTRETLLTGLYFVPAITLLHYMQESFRGCKRIITAQIFEQVLVPFGLVMIILVFMQENLQLRPSEVMIFQATLMFVSILILGYYFWDKIASQCSAKESIFFPKVWLKGALPFLSIGLVSVLLSRADVVIIGFMGEKEDAAVYAVVDRVSGLLVFGLSAVNAILAPTISELFHKGKISQLQVYISKLVGRMFAVTLLGAVVMVVFAQDILLLFGAEYTEYSRVLVILVVAQLVNVYFGPVGPIYQMTGNQSFFFFVLLLVCIVNIVLVPVAYAIGSIEAVALVKLLIFAVWNILLSVKALKIVGIYPGVVLRVSR